MSEEITLRLPDDIAAQLDAIDESRVNTVVSDALREALNLAESAEERRSELKERMGIGSRSTEELDDSELSDVEAKQEQLHRKRREGR